VKRIDLSGLVLDNAPRDYLRRKKPDWLRAKLPAGPGFRETRALVDRYALHTVCEEAKCPNLGECWSRGVATLMILGDTCTRSCGFCHIKTGRPPTLRPRRTAPRRRGRRHHEPQLRRHHLRQPRRVGRRRRGVWAETVREIRRQSPGTAVEVLIPDF
jgi:lipoyl synthase